MLLTISIPIIILSTACFCFERILEESFKLEYSRVKEVHLLFWVRNNNMDVEQQYELHWHAGDQSLQM